MLSQDEANRYIEKAAEELQGLSYEELEAMARRQEDTPEEPPRPRQVCGETVYVSTMITRFGRLRKRIGVEMILCADSGKRWPRVPCVYFERFKSGRLWQARTNKWEEAIFRALPYVFIGVVLGVGFLILRRILRWIES